MGRTGKEWHASSAKPAVLSVSRSDGVPIDSACLHDGPDSFCDVFGQTSVSASSLPQGLSARGLAAGRTAD